MKQQQKSHAQRLTLGVGATFAVSLFGMQIATAAENPFSLETTGAYEVAVDPSAAEKAKEVVKDAVESMSDAPGRDMAGNMVNYDYGGDSKGTYADGKVGTGAKDPSVCGSQPSAVCGADGGSHLK